MVTMILTSRQDEEYFGFTRKSTHELPVKISAFVTWIFSDLFSDLFSDDNAKMPHDLRQKYHTLFPTYSYPHTSTPSSPIVDLY